MDCALYHFAVSFAVLAVVLVGLGVVAWILDQLADPAFGRRENRPGDYPRLVEAAQEVIRVSDEFVEETGLKHGDPLTDAVNELRALLRDLGEEL